MKGKCVIVMGVSGSGKSTVAKLIAEKMNAEFVEGDELHPKENIEKMEHDIPLTDEDRKGWLEKIHSVIRQTTDEGNDCVISCSALKRKYRALLRSGIDNILFVYLKGSYELIHGWMQKRQHHFMPVDLLKSQFSTLEEPTAQEKDAVTINLGANIEEEMAHVTQELQLRKYL